LLDDANKALAAMIKAARADTGLDPKTSKNKPFWKSTQLIAKNLKMAKAGLTAKSNDFFKRIAEARQAEEQLKVDWELTDSKNSQVIENGKKLGHAIALLRTDFSKEAARKKNGRELTAKEKAEFNKIKAQQKAVSTGWQPAKASQARRSESVQWRTRLPDLRLRSAQPVRLPLFVKGGNPFARLFRFARLHVILKRKIDIFFHRA
jgi:hypothetical protein